MLNFAWTPREEFQFQFLTIYFLLKYVVPHVQIFVFNNEILHFRFSSSSSSFLSLSLSSFLFSSRPDDQSFPIKQRCLSRELWPARLKVPKNTTASNREQRIFIAKVCIPLSCILEFFAYFLKRTADETELPCNQARDKAQFSPIFAERVRIHGSPEAGSVSLLNLARVLQLSPSTFVLATRLNT